VKNAESEEHFNSPSINKIVVSSLYSNGHPKVKTVLAVGKETDLKQY
jgi:hypothetical protein